MPRNRTSAPNVAVPNNAETVIATLLGISAPAGDVVDIDGNVQLTAGATPGSLTLRIRRGVDTTGATVGLTTVQDFLANGHIVSGIQVSDALANDVANQSYVLTALQASGNACTATTATLNQIY